MIEYNADALAIVRLFLERLTDLTPAERQLLRDVIACLAYPPVVVAL